MPDRGKTDKFTLSFARRSRGGEDARRSCEGGDASFPLILVTEREPSGVECRPEKNDTGSPACAGMTEATLTEDLADSLPALELRFELLQLRT